MMMPAGTVCLLLLVLLSSLTLALAATPAPSTVFMRHAIDLYQPLIATCPITVVSNTSAFVCYTETLSGNQTVQYINPQTANANGVPSAVPSKSTFVHPPIALNPTTALAFSSNVNDSFYVMFNSTNPAVRYVGRHGSVADVVYAPDLNMSFVPLGVTPRVGWFDSIAAFNVSTRNESESLVWARDFIVPVNYPFTTRMSTPVYYQGYLYVATKDHVYQLNALTGQVTMNVSDPCNMALLEDQWLILQVVNIGEDANGSLDAFMLIANTSTAGLPRTTVCRISHHTLTQTWRTDYDDNLRIDDIIGVMDTLVISGLLTDIPNGYITWSMGASGGVHGGSITRYAQDSRSFPAILAQPVGGCQATIVLQVQGRLTSYCQSDVTTAIWSSDYSCTHRPTIDAASNSIVCTTQGTSLQRLDSDGSLIWQSTDIKAYFTAVVSGGLVWVVDQHATVYAVTLAPYLPPPPPMPSTLFRNQVSASVDVISAICPPTVVSTSSAFVCYKNNGTDTLQFINPSDATMNGLAIPFPQNTDSFIYPPIPVSSDTAIAFTVNATSSTYVVFNSTNTVSVKDRQGSTAPVAFAADTNTSFVPIGVNSKVGWYDSIVAFDINAVTEQSSLLWSVDFTVQPNYPYSTSVSTPVYYGGVLYVATRTKFEKYNATTGHLMATISNPCNFSATGPISMTVVTYGQDANGPLDAFIMYANTSTATSNGFSVCRVSHSTGAMEWQRKFGDKFLIHDVTGANSVIIISGEVQDYMNNPNRFAVFSLDAISGSSQGTLFRTSEDQQSFPVVLPQPVSGCVETVVLQVDGKLAAYCTEAIQLAPKWVSEYSCTHRPVADPISNSIVCTTWATSVQRLDSDGNAIWATSSISGVFTPFIVGGVVWVVDVHSTLYGLSLEPAGVSTTAAPQTATAAPAAPTSTTTAPQTAAPSSTTPAPVPTGPPQGDSPGGLGAGGATGVAFAVIIVVGGALGGAFIYHRRSVRRRAFRDVRTNEAINESGYGGLE